MVASLLESVSLAEQVRSLLAEVQSLRSEVADRGDSTTQSRTLWQINGEAGLVGPFQ